MELEKEEEKALKGIKDELDIKEESFLYGMDECKNEIKIGDVVEMKREPVFVDVVNGLSIGDFSAHVSSECEKVLDDLPGPGGYAASNKNFGPIAFKVKDKYKAASFYEFDNISEVKRKNLPPNETTKMEALVKAQSNLSYLETVRENISQKISLLNSSFGKNIQVREIVKPIITSENILYNSYMSVNDQLLPNEYLNNKDSYPANTLRISESKCLVCEICCKSFIRKYDLRRHMLSHFDERPFACDLCEKSFKMKNELKMHAITHSNEKPHVCEICKKSFKRKINFRSHMRMHSGVQRFICETCRKSFCTKGGLIKHMICHSDERPYACKLCDNTFKAKCVLRQHMITHSELKPYVCNICQKSFKRKSDFKSHSTTHSEEKMFVCKICQKLCNRKSDLQRHLLCHSDEKPFECQVCGKTFKSKRELTPHMITHSDAKPFFCKICKKYFKRKADFKCHIKMHSSKFDSSD